MVGMNLLNPSFASSTSAIGKALDIGDLDHFTTCLKQLLDHDLVRKKPPTSIRDVMGYYVNMDAFERLLRELDPEGLDDTPKPETDWKAVSEGIRQLEVTIENSELSQTERAQAGAIVASLKILIEAPEPPKKAIRNLLYDLAALAAIFAFAAQLASMIF